MTATLIQRIARALLPAKPPAVVAAPAPVPAVPVPAEPLAPAERKIVLEWHVVREGVAFSTTLPITGEAPRLRSIFQRADFKKGTRGERHLWKTENAREGLPILFDALTRDGWTVALIGAATEAMRCLLDEYQPRQALLDI